MLYSSIIASIRRGILGPVCTYAVLDTIEDPKQTDIEDELDVRRGITGAELVRMMRRYRVTIRELAKRTGITQSRIRQCRRSGVQFPACLDWLEAIRGRLTDRERAVLNQYRVTGKV